MPNEIKKAKIIYIKSDGDVYIDNLSNEFKTKSYWYDYIPVIGIYSEKWFPLLSQYKWDYRKIDLEKKNFFTLNDIQDEINNKKTLNYQFFDKKCQKAIKELKSKYNSYSSDQQKKNIENEVLKLLNKDQYNYIKDNFTNMNIYKKHNFIFLGFLMYKYKDQIISIIENHFPQDIIKSANIS